MATWQVSTGSECITLEGDLRLADATAIWHSLQKCTADVARGQRVDLDLSRASAIDGSVMALLVELRTDLIERGAVVELVGGSESIEAIARLFGAHRAVPHAIAAPRRSITVQIGKAAAGVATSAKRAIGVVGELTAGIAQVVRHPKLGGWKELGPLVSRAGADGMVIVLVLDFLVGFVMAFQSTRQLQNFGANIYVADVVGIAMPRELAPLITAIIISGRSGAGFAAELGTMRVSEEIDALRTMGFAPVPYLVVPRVIALAIVAPVLVLLGDLAGVVGGLTVAKLYLGIEPRAYLVELQSVVVTSDVWTGLIKAFAFGIAIAVIGCEQGLSTRGSASGVGRSTTTTVVICLFTLVAIDTALTMVFRGAGV